MPLRCWLCECEPSRQIAVTSSFELSGRGTQAPLEF
ncbi:hypothetical protein MKAN_07330 [Mycobacterium kansasii ATCC 12478]|uniref:Uncharacterized protein n=1 Tax=Mycobacterium kansasii ATCC 12478 TaxID=557599 RepID=U5X1N5_MYCKA|nr:hypothetical protein MKAN_07330 [Mycobacterium kansasii ATCC 12478]